MHHSRGKLALCRVTSAVYLHPGTGVQQLFWSKKRCIAPALARYKPFSSIPTIHKSNEATCYGA